MRILQAVCEKSLGDATEIAEAVYPSGQQMMDVLALRDSR